MDRELDRRLGEILREARKDAGLRQEDVVGRLGKKHQSFVAKYETGERRLSTIEFVKVALAIGASPETLIAVLTASVVAARGRGAPRGPRTTGVARSAKKHLTGLASREGAPRKRPKSSR